jgi:two-component system, NarL family, response regulator DesR
MSGPPIRKDRQQATAKNRWGVIIGAELHLPQGTVRNYLSEVMAKLGAANRTDAARIARGRGWL